MSAGASSAQLERRRARVRVRGTVQGVGFRPYVYRLACEHELGGFVLNDSRGVLLEVEGSASAVEGFLARLPRETPPLAVVEDISAQECDALSEIAFAIHQSPHEGTAQTPVTPDSATCADCLRELFDPADRRYRYAFINCTNCGPRFTIVRGIPYDRTLTTMAGFAMCAACSAEYEDPSDRRFHAQPNACARCGPSVALLDGRERAPTAAGSSDDALRAAARELARGAIVAVKGIGGYHLACDASDEVAVSALRARKHREERPFALMVGSLEDAEALARLSAAECELLSGPERAIVLAPRADASRERATRGESGGRVAASVAPGAPELGIMLAYSPLHHLLVSDFAEATGGRGALVMTSGNVSDEPIAYRDDDARERLAGIADLVLTHDRPIQTRTDDSVLRVVRTHGRARSLFLRRSRGYVPASVPLRTRAVAPILAVGAELKNTFCMCKGERAWVGHHIGDLENFETLRSFESGIEHFQRLFEVAPEIVAHDLHPEYLSTKYALELDGAYLEGVQHHHAHLAACLAEHAHAGTAVGAIFDGTGYGSDGTIWGGELLVGDTAEFTRAGMLTPVPLPGGAAAIREPWRMACVWLQRSGAGAEVPRALAGTVDAERWRQVSALAHSDMTTLTSSMGRLFDAVSAICGVRATVSYEGQAAIELEAACDPGERGAYEIAVSANGDSIELDPREMIRAVAADANAGVSSGRIASRFHAALAAATGRACALAASAAGTDTVVLSGGVFANRRLLQASAARLVQAGLRVLIPERLPVGDGGISYGQAVVAAQRAMIRTAAPREEIHE
jgi:hydrogenase maturation protein HypF